MYIEGLDEIDNQIINIIKRDARLSYSDIGDKLNISRVTVKNRMNALEEKGIICGYETVINPRNLPEGRTFFIDICTEPDKFEEIVDFLARYEIVKKIYALTGECRIRVEGYATSKMKYEMFFKNLRRNMQGMKSCQVSDVLDTIMDKDGGVRYTPLNERKDNEN